MALPGSAEAIVGGSQVSNIDSFPFQVELWNQLGGNPVDGFFCGGVILDATHVATAAHCVFDEGSGQATPPGQLHVLAGTNDLNQSGTDDTAAAASFDPRYDPTTNDYDMGVITLSQPLWSGTTPALDGTTPIAPVPPIPAADPMGFAAAGKTATASGWGDTTQEPVNGTPNPTYPTILRSVSVPVVSSPTCADNNHYGGLGLGITPRMLCAGSTGHDACFGDSGGPLVVLSQSPGTTPDDYVLAGLVESGAGCGQPNLPGIYDRVADADVGTFITSNPPQAPQQQSPTTVSGTPAAGQTVSCQAGAWSGGPSFQYQFYKDLGNQNFQRIAGPAAQSTYAVQPADAGSQIFCVVKATAAGGYGFGVSADVTGSGPILTTPPPPVTDTKRPTLAVARKSCSTRGRCVVNLQVADPSPSAGIAKVDSKLRWRTIVRCHTRRSGRCAKTKTKTVRAKAIGGGHYLIVVSHLSPRTYALILRAVDKAGNHQRSSTYVTLKVKRR